MYLCLCMTKKLFFTAYENHTINFISQVVKKGLHLKEPRLVSPHYQQSSVILFHLARLMTEINQTQLSDLKPLIIQDLSDQYKAAHNAMEKVILQTTLLRMGTVLPVPILTGLVSKRDQESF